MGFWSRTLADQSRLDALVSRGLLCEGDYLLPSSEDAPDPSVGFVVLFMHFHERSLMMPPHPFLVGVLHLDQNQLHHLNLNGVQHMVAFVALCEGYLGTSTISAFGATPSRPSCSATIDVGRPDDGDPNWVCDHPPTRGTMAMFVKQGLAWPVVLFAQPQGSVAGHDS
jgi:hypothetical protein